MAVYNFVLCPHCNSSDVVKNGFSSSGGQRYRCRNQECPAASFMLDHKHPGRTREVQQKIIDMSINGSGTRDIARVLGISKDTVTKVIKKKGPKLQQVNLKLLEKINAEDADIDIICINKIEGNGIKEAELDEMWSYVQNKTNQRWLWQAMERTTGQMIAYVFGKRQDQVFLQLRQLLEPFGIKKFYTDDWATYHLYLPKQKLTTGKKYTQKIERKQLTLRTRIKRLTRKTICFSKSEEMHDTVIGLFINRYDFGLNI